MNLRSSVGDDVIIHLGQIHSIPGSVTGTTQTPQPYPGLPDLIGQQFGDGDADRHRHGDLGLVVGKIALIRMAREDESGRER